MMTRSSERGFVSRGIRHLTPSETLAACRDGAILVDVREESLSRFKRMDVPEWLFYPLSRLPDFAADLPPDRMLIFADSTGLRSREAVEFLAGSGFAGDICNMAGGLVEWERDGLPLVVDRTERLSGSCMCQLRPREKP